MNRIYSTRSRHTVWRRKYYEYILGTLFYNVQYTAHTVPGYPESPIRIHSQFNKFIRTNLLDVVFDCTISMIRYVMSRTLDCVINRLAASMHPTLNVKDNIFHIRNLNAVEISNIVY